MLLTAQVVRGSVGSLNVMVGDRLELDACDLELVCTLYLVPSTFEVSAESQGGCPSAGEWTQQTFSIYDPSEMFRRENSALEITKAVTAYRTFSSICPRYSRYSGSRNSTSKLKATRGSSRTGAR